MFHIISIPSRRVPVLIGEEGQTKKHIEKNTGAKLKVDLDGCIEIEGEAEGVLTAINIAKAIGRGFRPERAFLLLKEDYQLNIIPIEGSESARKRISSRVIGKQGGSRKNVERLTGAFVCIYGKTISVIGEGRRVAAATSAIEDLIDGRTHAFVYSKLERAKKNWQEID